MRAPRPNCGMRSPITKGCDLVSEENCAGSSKRRYSACEKIHKPTLLKTTQKRVTVRCAAFPTNLSMSTLMIESGWRRWGIIGGDPVTGRAADLADASKGHIHSALSSGHEARRRTGHESDLSSPND